MIETKSTNLMLQEIEAGRELAKALRRYLDIAEIGQAIVATVEDERELKLRALDVYNSLNRCGVVMPIPPDKVVDRSWDSDEDGK